MLYFKNFELHRIQFWCLLFFIGRCLHIRLISDGNTVTSTNQRFRSLLASTASKAGLSLLSVVISTGILSAQENDKFQKQLSKAVDKFQVQKSAAKKAVLKRFDSLRAKIKRERSLSESSRAEMMQRLTEYRKQFEQNDSFPEMVETIELEIYYQTKLGRAFKPIMQSVEKELGNANKDGNSSYAKKLLELKQRLESQLLASKQIKSGSEFSGRLTRSNGATIPYKLKIENISESGDFVGIVHDNAGVAGHWKFRVKGKRNGNLIQFSMTENLRGKFTAVKGEGVVSETRLLAVVTQKTGKSKATRNHVVLHR